METLRNQGENMDENLLKDFPTTVEALKRERIFGHMHKVSLDEICEERTEQRKSKRFLSNQSFGDKSQEMEIFFDKSNPKKDQLCSESEVWLLFLLFYRSLNRHEGSL